MISTPLRRFLTSVKELMENHPENPENSKTVDLLLRMQSAFARPQIVGASASDANHEQRIRSSNFRQLLDQIGISVPAKALVSTEVGAGQRTIGRADDGKRVGLPEMAYD
ncbi:hypothetical protein FS837_007858, partial [Tulasnella sp. UAMH 9824]